MITFGSVAIAELAGLVEPRAVGTAPLFLHEAFGNFRGGEGRGSRDPEEPAAASQAESTELKLRTDCEYRRLALQILKCQAWKTRRANSGRLKNRALSGG